MHEVPRMSKHENGIWSALGLMSGTSLDGIDIALIETDGNEYVQQRETATYAYSDQLRTQLRNALIDATQIIERSQRPGRLKLLEQYLTDLHAEAVAHYLVDHEVPAESVDLIGFHGQTVLHRPEQGLTVQLGDGPRLAELTGRTVIYDMRAADVEAGGQGAPFVPAYHRAAVSHIEDRPIAVVNIGGVANLTFIGRDNQLCAFDTGPGNALIDDWMNSRTGEQYDMNGETAARGQVNEDALSALLTKPFFDAPPPKSLDRNDFSIEPVKALTLEDGAATLTAFTAETLSRSASLLPEAPKCWVICGGGRKNAQLMKMLRERINGNVMTAEDADLNGDSVEAEAWAYLAVRAALKAPLTFPQTTGVTAPMTGGKIARAPAMRA